MCAGWLHYVDYYWSTWLLIWRGKCLQVQDNAIRQIKEDCKLLHQSMLLWCGSFDQSPVDKRNFDQSPIDQRFFDQRVPLTRGSVDQRVPLTRGSLWPEVPLTRGFLTRGFLWPEGLIDQRVYLTRGSIWPEGLFDLRLGMVTTCLPRLRSLLTRGGGPDIGI